MRLYTDLTPLGCSFKNAVYYQLLIRLWVLFYIRGLPGHSPCDRVDNLKILVVHTHFLKQGDLINDYSNAFPSLYFPPD